MKIFYGNKADVNIVFVFEDKDLDSHENYIKVHGLDGGKLGKVYTEIKEDEKHNIFIGLGKEAELCNNKLRKAAFTAGKELVNLECKSANIDLTKINLDNKKSVFTIYQGLVNGVYDFDKYKTDKKDLKLEEIYINTSDENIVKKLEEDYSNLFEAVNFTKNLVNEPAVYMTPTKLAEKAKGLEEYGVKVTVYGKKEIEEIGMEAYLSVAKGSDEEPQFIVMEYLKGGDKETLGLVGKGLTYDTGGYSLKPSNFMDTMFTDMGGAATVIGTMKAISKSNIKANVIAVVAACENAIDGSAIKPGDIISSLSKKTIEVANTDAEGRVTLADAMYYITSEKKVDKVIDLATLTGAAIVVLSDVATPAITNDEEFLKPLLDIAEKSGEPIWQLPVYPIFKERIKSKRADLINTESGIKGAGTITAGLFVGEFVKGDIPWIHLDIAGTAYIEAERDHFKAGATGIHVTTLYKFIKNNFA